MPAFFWTKDQREAKREQGTMKELVTLQTDHKTLHYQRGFAIGTAYGESLSKAIAVAIPFDEHGRPGQHILEADAEIEFPYIPGLLAFRVGPAICKLLDQVETEIDLLIFDGQGIAHPRGLGIASHIGVLYNIPSIGVTRNNLYGAYIEPPKGRGNRSELTHPRTGATIGFALSLGEECEPCFVSPGHRVSIIDTAEIICKMTKPNSCFPEALQKAHRVANSVAKRN
jgi:deoxyribonuclease V